MTRKEKLEEELSQLLNAAPDHRRKQVLESVEYKIAIQDGDVAGAYEFAYGIVIGSGKTKREAKKNAKQIKKDDFLREIA